MRVAIISSHPIQYNAPLFERLAKRGKLQIKVFYTWGDSVITNKFDPGFGKEIQWDIPLLNGYEYEFLENVAKDIGSHHYNGIDNPDIVKVVTNFNPDAAIVYGWSFKSHFKLMRALKGKIPIFVRGDSTLLVDSSFLTKLKRKIFLKFIYKFSDFALYVGQNSYDYFINAGLKKHQLFLAPHVIDNERFVCKTPDCLNLAASFREKFNIKQDDFVFLFAGKFEDNKNTDLLIDAFKQAQFNHNVHLVLVGNGPLEVQLKKMAQFPNIHFLDFQNQKSMPAIYGMCEVFVLPSQSETWGLALNEAMAGGKAIIASDKCGGAIDLIDEGKNGYIFKSKDAADLRKKLLCIYENKDHIKEMGKFSEKIVASFTIEKLAEKFEEAVIAGVAKKNG